METSQFDEILKKAVESAFKKAGAVGGNSTKKKYGKEHYAEIGRKGGLKRAENHKKKLSTDGE